MVREPDAAMQPAPQDDQLMSKHCVLSFKPNLRLKWRGQDGQNETEQPDHSASLGDSITSSTRIRFSVHTAAPATRGVVAKMRFQIMPERLDDRRKQFPDLSDIISIANPLEGNEIDLEGNKLVVVRVGHTDTDDTTCLYVPSIGLVVAGDVVYNGIHPFLSESNRQTRLENRRSETVDGCCRA
jgi:hypothetical protein